jgi:hypothetical protein
MPEEEIHPPDFDFSTIRDPDRCLYMAISAMAIIAFKSSGSASITLEDEEIPPFAARLLSPDFARGFFPDNKVVGTVALLCLMDLVRIEQDETLPAGRRIQLYYDPATGKRSWDPSPDPMARQEVERMLGRSGPRPGPGRPRGRRGRGLPEPGQN